MTIRIMLMKIMLPKKIIWIIYIFLNIVLKMLMIIGRLNLYVTGFIQLGEVTTEIRKAWWVLFLVTLANYT